ncbi:MAG: hypothetical protein IJ363_13965 [Clostridia bacterium]|nr:hypothetical protein [Clostridia bacterium]
MRRVLSLIALVVILTSCGMTATTSRVTEVGFLDYRPFTEQGFWLSADPYMGDHIPIGQIYLKVSPGREVKETVKKDTGDGRKFEDGVYGTRTRTFAGLEKISSGELLQMAVDVAKEAGADGIADLETRVVYAAGLDIVDYYEVSGMAIKRK